MVRIGINGACGRMGLTVGRLALEDRAFTIADALESDNSPALGKDYGELLGKPPLGVRVARELSDRAEAVIDFSTPEASLRRLEECVRRKRAMVVCTTGFADEQRAKIATAARTVPVLLASNTSVGVNVLFRIAAEVAALLGPEYDLDIVETHHRFKKDAPSGTAKTLAEEIKRATGRDAHIASVRSGDVVGDHRIVYGSLGDAIEIRHTAGSRDIFGKGALRAAAWLAGRPPGLYSMRDVLEPRQNAPEGHPDLSP